MVTIRRLVVGYAHLGRMEEARAALANYRELEPQASIELLAKALPFKRQDDLERFLDGLRKAGLPGAGAGARDVAMRSLRVCRHPRADLGYSRRMV